jgi:hypothetical protein
MDLCQYAFPGDHRIFAIHFMVCGTEFQRWSVPGAISARALFESVRWCRGHESAGSKCAPNSWCWTSSLELKVPPQLRQRPVLAPQQLHSQPCGWSRTQPKRNFSGGESATEDLLPQRRPHRQWLGPDLSKYRPAKAEAISPHVKL